MEQSITIFFGGSWIGIAIFVGLMIAFYKWTRSKWVVAIAAVFLIITRFTWISIEDRPSEGDGSIAVIKSPEKE